MKEKMKRGDKLSNEISISELLELRKTMSVKQMASVLDVSVNTIYRYIGNNSVANDRKKRHNVTAISYKPCQKKSAVNQAKSEVVTVQDAVPIARPVMKVLKKKIVVDLQGSVCVYHMDSSSNSVEMKDENGSTITGIISVDDIPLFVAELQDIYKTMRETERGV